MCQAIQYQPAPGFQKRRDDVFYKSRLQECVTPNQKQKQDVIEAWIAKNSDTFKQQFREIKPNSPLTVLVQQEPFKARQHVEKEPP